MPRRRSLLEMAPGKVLADAQIGFVLAVGAARDECAARKLDEIGVVLRALAFVHAQRKEVPPFLVLAARKVLAARENLPSAHSHESRSKKADRLLFFAESWRPPALSAEKFVKSVFLMARGMRFDTAVWNDPRWGDATSSFFPEDQAAFTKMKKEAVEAVADGLKPYDLGSPTPTRRLVELALQPFGIKTRPLFEHLKKADSRSR